MSITSEADKPWSKLKWRWPERARLAAAHLNSEASVVDLGCGAGSLRDVLRHDIRYIGVDVVARDEDTIVVDFNNEQIPAIDADAAALLGVIEYISDPLQLLTQLNKFPKSVVTYNYYSASDFFHGLGLHKRKVKWQHRLFRWKFESLLQKAGLHVMVRQKVKYGEMMYVCVPAGKVG